MRFASEFARPRMGGDGAAAIQGQGAGWPIASAALCAPATVEHRGSPQRGGDSAAQAWPYVLDGYIGFWPWG